MAIGFNNTKSPQDAAANQRALIQQQGDNLNQENQDQGDQATQQTSQYQGFLDPIEQQMASGQGGYNADETAAIEDQGGLNQISSELGSNYLTGDEQSAMMGNTGSYGNYFDPTGSMDMLGQGQNKQDIASGNLQSGLNNAIDPNALKQSQSYADTANNQVQSNQSQFLNTLNAEANNVRGAIDPSALQQSSSAAQAETMSPEDRQAMITAAGISAGVQNQAAVGTLQRQALAAGSSPQGVAAYRARMNQQSAIEGADAMTAARAATQAQSAQEATTAEQQREGAQQYLTSTQTGTEENMGQQAVAGIENLGQQALTQQNTQEQNRQAAEQYLTGAQLQAATTGGEASLQNAQTETGQTTGQQQFNTTAGTNITEAQDQANAARAASVAQNRQQVNANNQQTQLNISNTQSGRATTVGNTRLNQQNTGLGLQQGEQQMYNANAQGAYGRQQQTYATQAGAGNQATSNVINASGVPTTTDKIIGGVSGALGAAASFLADGDVATEPTLAVVGERGPEEIVPVPDNSVGGMYRARAPKVQQIPPPKKPGRKVYGEAA